MCKDKSSIGFGLGLLAGVLGGIAAGILFAPCPGEEMRAKVKDTVTDLAEKYSPERVFDIETRRTLSYFNGGDIDKFLEGYQAYRQGVAEGKSSVHGRTIEV